MTERLSEHWTSPELSVGVDKKPNDDGTWTLSIEVYFNVESKPGSGTWDTVKHLLQYETVVPLEPQIQHYDWS